ncbi:hypothetical protein JCGZ_06046 [Jatropha curcas]|uniref:Uncharacterized protein n=1 Tax=Jatropha curcas TaxID=180498 RepID=A0A067KXJ0_JATCU|nr:hypothetical protein JCGZ_06046 [Jatropha curcas]
MASYAIPILFLILFASYNTVIARKTRVPKTVAVADENKENPRIIRKSKIGVGGRGSPGGGPGRAPGGPGRHGNIFGKGKWVFDFQYSRKQTRYISELFPFPKRGNINPLKVYKFHTQ